MYWTSLRGGVRGLKVHEKWQCVQVPCLSLETSLGLLLHYLHKLRTATFFFLPGGPPPVDFRSASCVPEMHHLWSGRFSEFSGSRWARKIIAILSMHLPPQP